MRQQTTVHALSYISVTTGGSLPPQPALDSILTFAQIQWEVWTHSRGGVGDEYGKDWKSLTCMAISWKFNYYKRDNIM